MSQIKKKTSDSSGFLKDTFILWSLILAALIVLILIIRPDVYHILHKLDIQSLKSINSNRIEELDPLFLFLTNTSSLVCLLISATVLLAGYIKRSANLKLKGFQLLLTFLTSFVFIKSLKYLIGRQRPYISYDFLDKLAQAESLSFPSGHTFEAFAFATAVMLLFKIRWVQFLILFWACLIGASRIILGMHYLSDVAGGVIFGVLTAYFLHVLYRKNIEVV